MSALLFEKTAGENVAETFCVDEVSRLCNPRKTAPSGYAVRSGKDGKTTMDDRPPVSSDSYASSSTPSQSSADTPLSTNKDVKERKGLFL